jgi:hypothetical protein
MPLKNMAESSISHNNKWNKSVDHKFLFKDNSSKNFEKNKLENYQTYNQNSIFNSLVNQKMEQNKKNLNKKQISVEILNLNRKIKNDLNNKLNENDYMYREIKSEKQNNIDINIYNTKDSINNNNKLNTIDNNKKTIDDNKININNNPNVKANININANSNSINDNNNIKINTNDNSLDLKKNINNNNIIVSSMSDLNILNKVKRFNNQNSSSIEKQIQANNQNFEKNINISMFNFKKFKKAKLNIHSLSSGIQAKDFNLELNKNKIIPIYLPPLNKNKSNNQHQHLLIPNIKQFKFKITKKKKIKYINFNHNKIIENNNTNQEGQKSPFTQFLYKCVQSTNAERNFKNDLNEEIDGNTEIYKRLMKNDNNSNNLNNGGVQLGKSQSSGLFPKIKIS